MDIFCSAKRILNGQIIHETDNFFVLHDGYPLAEGHLFLIPKNHFDCLLHVDKKWTEELNRLKDQLRHFLIKYYQEPVMFEHGGVAQTVLHAHLHFLPTSLSLLLELRKVAKILYKPTAPYLYYEENNRGTYFTPTKKIPPGYLHTAYARLLGRPLVGMDRAKDLPKWLLSVKEKWQLWQEAKS